MITVATIDKSDLNNNILFIESDNAYINENGLAKSEFHPVGNKVTFHSKGFSVSWRPNAMKYVDEFGMEDTIYSVQDAPLTVKDNKARFDRSFPDVDDMFIVDGDRLKHTIIVQGWQRDPVPWLSGNVDFVISGRLEFDPNLTVHSMGMNIIGPFTTAESIEIRRGSEVVFTLPKIVAFDSDIPNRNETFGRYKVTSNENGQLSFDIVMDNTWMTSKERVYPVLIDPTVVVPSPFDISGNNGRKIIALFNNWLICVVNGNGKPMSFISKDKGATWFKQWEDPTSSCTSLSITKLSKTKPVYGVLFTISQGDAWFAVIQADTGNGGTTRVDSNQYNNIGFCSVAVNENCTEVHGVWQSMNISYAQNTNIRYAKGTIDSNGNVTWGSVTQLTRSNGYSYSHPSIVVSKTGEPVLFVIFNNPFGPRVWVMRPTGLDSYSDLAWTAKLVNSDLTAQSKSSPCGLVGDNGDFHVVWMGKDGAASDDTWNIKYNKSSDLGVTWGSQQNLTTGKGPNWQDPVIGVNNENKLFVFYYQATPTTGIYLRTNDGSGWATATNINPGNNVYVNVMEREFSSLLGWVYKDNSEGSIKFDSMTFNTPPTAPTDLSPNGTSINRAQVQRLSWKYNDTAGDGQSKFDLQWRPVGSNTWNTVTQTTPNQYWDAPSNNFPRGNIEWQVRTYDQSNVVGPYSAQAVFLAGDKPAPPTILDPAATIPVPRPNVSWSSSGQTAYQVQVLDGQVVAWDSGEIVSGSKLVTVGTDLVNNKTYTFKVRIKNADGLWSDWAQVSRLVSYTPPATPLITVTPQNEKIVVQINNPTPTGSQPIVAYNNLYRKKTNDSTWTRIACNIPTNGFLVDYTVASDALYDYKVEAVGNNGTIAESAIKSGKTTFGGVWLHCVDDPSNTIHRFALSEGNGDEWNTDRNLMKFAGRTKPVAEFGVNDEGRITANLKMLKGRGDREALQRIVYRKTTVCYRDNRGRKMFGVIFQLPSDDTFYGYSVSLTIDEIDFKEDV